MKKYVFVLIAICFSIYMFGCAKKQSSIEETQEPMSIEQLGTLKTQESLTPQVSESNVSITQTPVATTGTKLEILPPAGPYKPTTLEIQTALKNAGFYTATIDGRKGKLTEQAIKEFQKANGLEADGKVGSKTWGLLSQHLNPAPVSKKKSALKTR